MVTIGSVADFAAAVSRAQTVSLTAYTLREGAVRTALVAAARRGARVTVRLERDPLDDASRTLHTANDATVAALRAAGATASLTRTGEPVLHMKAAVADGVAWLDDRNWAGDGSELVVRDSDRDDVAVVAAAVGGGRGSDPHLATTKAGAQRLEADVLAHAGAKPLALESESFGSGAIYNALLHRARAAQPTRVIVAQREFAEPANHGERTRLAKLASLGIEVRVGNAATGDLDEKLAVHARDAWVGSANATYARGAYGAQREWGLATREPGMIDGLRAIFERNWSSALPLAEVMPHAVAE